MTAAMSMDENEQKQQFSFAYIRAVAAAAGFAVSRPEVDDDSIDLQITARGDSGTISSPKIELQVKCTSQNVVKDQHIAYSLNLKNYNELRMTTPQIPRILVVIVVPADVDDWLAQSEEALMMHHCGYWVSLCGRETTTNQYTVTVHLPRNQLFSSTQLRGIMTRVAECEKP